MWSFVLGTLDYNLIQYDLKPADIMSVVFAHFVVVVKGHEIRFGEKIGPVRGAEGRAYLYYQVDR
jgi:hypothetical protein